MSILGWEFHCPDCASNIRTVNPGTTHRHTAVAVIACETCGEEWAARVTVERLHAPGVATPSVRSGVRQYRNSSLIDAKAAEAHSLIENGRPVRIACELVGIDPHSYYNRYRSTA